MLLLVARICFALLVLSLAYSLKHLSILALFLSFHFFLYLLHGYVTFWGLHSENKTPVLGNAIPVLGVKLKWGITYIGYFSR